MTEKLKKKFESPLLFIAEDIPQNLQVLYGILKKENYRIAAAGNGRKALQMIPEVHPDLILLDVMMPEMSGFDVCIELKKDPRTSDIPIIFLTAKAESEDIVKGFEIGAVDYITKPFNGAELLSRIKTHLELKFAREYLKELIATKDTFFSIIAHDLKNPVQCFLLYTDALYRNYNTLDESKKLDYIQRCFNSATQVSALLENLLDWAGTQRRLIEYHPARIDIHQIVLENIELVKEHASQKNIMLSCRVAENTFAYADSNMIRTVFRNLVGNAVKFTPNGGSIKITATNNGQNLELSVADTGIGIEQSLLDSLFKINVNHSALGTAREKGTGLGLMLCKEFIQLNHGTISVSSEPGKGSCFTFTLPVAGPEA